MDRFGIWVGIFLLVAACRSTERTVDVDGTGNGPDPNSIAPVSDITTENRRADAVSDVRADQAEPSTHDVWMPSDSIAADELFGDVVDGRQSWRPDVASAMDIEEIAIFDEVTPTDTTGDDTSDALVGSDIFGSMWKVCPVRCDESKDDCEEKCGPCHACKESYCVSIYGMAGFGCYVSDNCPKEYPCKMYPVCDVGPNAYCGWRYCLYPTKFTIPCDDGNPCTVNDTCADGECKGAFVQDGEPCPKTDPCHEASCQGGTCVTSLLPDGTPCDGDAPCFPNCNCVGGICQ